MMENQAQYNRQVAGVQDPPKGTYEDTWTGGETPPSRASAIKNPVTRPQMRNEVKKERGQIKRKIDMFLLAIEAKLHPCRSCSL